mgnify:CR=1 FL=1
MTSIIFFGPPGAGKGTQAKKISTFLNLPHISTGDVLRSKIKQNDQLALELKKIMTSGKLVSDEILNKIVLDKLLNDCRSGFILDGYPRTLHQSQFLNDFLEQSKIKLSYIFNIDIDFKILEERILKRSKEENRDDDDIDVIKVRYQAYLDTTQKVSDHYMENNKDIFYNIHGDDKIDEITNKIIKILKND